MKDGLINIALCTPRLSLGDAYANAEACVALAREAAESASVAVFPELSLVGATAGDLLQNRQLLSDCTGALEKILESTKALDLTLSFGMPVLQGAHLYDAYVVACHGEILGVVPRVESRSRQFADYLCEVCEITLLGKAVPFGTDIIFSADAHPDFKFAVAVGDDLTSPAVGAEYLALAGANLIINPTATPETVGAGARLKTKLLYLSDSLKCAVASVSSGKGESTTDAVYGARRAVASLGEMLAESPAFSDGAITYATLDLEAISAERAKTRAFSGDTSDGVLFVEYFFPRSETKIINKPAVSPFIPSDAGESALAEILDIQKNALAERILRSHSKGIVLGLSGGLDSTLALLVAVGATDILGLPRESILSVTMPCFGTTQRTKSNAESLAAALGTAFREINIADAVNLHFRDIGHDPENRNVVFENSQARERTQILMDLANANGALVLGTGDMSELALGFATYNGDHMSMYGVNAGVPKTLMRALVGHVAKLYDKAGENSAAAVLRDILATPVSPELLPPKDGEIEQCTEDIVGPYELHDFFLYYLLKYGFSPKKILRLALSAFDGKYTEQIIRAWLKIFLRRFTTQQFKRSCMPDGPRVSELSLSPRGGLEMPSDMSLGIFAKFLSE